MRNGIIVFSIILSSFNCVISQPKGNKYALTESEIWNRCNKSKSDIITILKCKRGDKGTDGNWTYLKQEIIYIFKFGDSLEIHQLEFLATDSLNGYTEKVLSQKAILNRFDKDVKRIESIPNSANCLLWIHRPNTSYYLPMKPTKEFWIINTYYFIPEKGKIQGGATVVKSALLNLKCLGLKQNLIQRKEMKKIFSNYDIQL